MLQRSMRSERLILASASPRRRDLLAQLGVPFDVIVAPRNEPQDKPAQANPRAWAAALAYFKARAVADLLATPAQAAPETTAVHVLGADTIVECNGAVLGKPRDRDDARRMLLLQAGRGCDVITGVCLLRVAEHTTTRDIRLARTHVWMRNDAAELDRYVDSGDWEGKAGAYGIQDIGDRLVERIDGSFSNVVGLPLEMLTRMWSAACG